MDSSCICEECGKAFADSARLFTHQKKSCRPGKRSLRELLSDARHLWKAKQLGPRKRAKLSEGASQRSTDQARNVSFDRSNSPMPIPPSPAEPSHPQQAPCTPLMETPVGSLGLQSHSPMPLETLNTRVTEIPSQTLGPCSSTTNSSNPLDLAGERLQPAPEVPSQRVSRWTTARDLFGLFKQFDYPPSRDPAATVITQHHSASLNASASTGNPKDDAITSHNARTSRATAQKAAFDASTDYLRGSLATQPTSVPEFYPYPNWSSFELGDLLWSRGPINSLDRFKELIQLLRNPSFTLEDVRHADWTSIHERLAHGIQPGLDTSADWVDDIGPGWTTTNISLTVPFHTRGHGANVETFAAGVLHHRKIVSVIKEKLTDPVEHSSRHFQAHQLYWQPDVSKEPVRVYGEVYSSDEFRKMEEEVRNQTLHNEEDQGLERVVLALMFWSDATLLANFGLAKLWPCYLFFGNDSKYLRACPTFNLCNHIAYFESLPAHFKDWYRSKNQGHDPPQSLVTHCTREIFQRQWDILLDDELVEAMKNGIRIKCPDNVIRLFFPRIFTFSADYPEKALIATIRALGAAPCPRCFMKKCDMHKMGSEEDMAARTSGRRVDDPLRQEQVQLARSLIFGEGYAVTSKKLDAHLPRAESMVPVENVFSKISSLGFNVYSSLVVDFMHEFELGVWKAIFIQLIRILEAEDRSSKGVVGELDQRYRNIPAFGPDTIRKFTSNASEQKKLAARDYANLLQCAIPACDGLLPEPHNTIVHDLLFVLAEWHALAKLRMHTELTVNLLEAKTAELARQVCKFKEVTCQAYHTVETKKEYAARLKRSAKKTQQPGSVPGAPPVETDWHSNAPSLPAEPEVPSLPPAATSKSKLRKTLNIQTYKYHALADFAEHIRQFGTVDSYSTERGELEHKFPKSWFPRTNKRAYRRQLARIERRRANLRKIRQKANGEFPAEAKSRKRGVPVPGRFCSYVIAKSQNSHEPMSQFVPQEANKNDPALKDFLPNLQEHVRLRMEAILRHQHPERFAEGGGSIDKSYLSVEHNRIYSHKTAHLAYSTYDGRKGDDIVWPSCAKANIMLLNPHRSSTQDHPFIYGKVLGVFHINVTYVKGFQDLPPQRLDFFWVRWYRWQGNSAGTRGLDLVAFPPVTDPGSFGFVDPGDVLRACHIIPRSPMFPGKPPVPLKESLSEKTKDAADYAAYFVNRFADRDMFMRYQWGYAVGHRYTHESPLSPPNSAPLAIRPSRPQFMASPPGAQGDNELQATDDDGGLDDDEEDNLIRNGEDEMIYQRSDAEPSDEENQDTDGSEAESGEE